jgi:hypothetical protein
MQEACRTALTSTFAAKARFAGIRRHRSKPAMPSRSQEL